MSEVIKIHLEWKYTPVNYFEEPINIKGDGFQLSISDGVALAKIEPLLHSRKPEIKEELTRLIENRLHALQIISHRDFTLSKPSRTDLKEDGTRGIFLQIDELAIATSICPVDLIIRDKNGNIVTDTKQERVDRQNWFAETVDKYRTMDVTLDQMLKSYQMAVKDPKDELVHLYEIRDALSSRFRNRKNAIKALGIIEKEWGIIGDLADNQPLKEGRHRGKNAGTLRPAEKHELEMARKSVVNLVEKYLILLETKKHK